MRCLNEQIATWRRLHRKRLAAGWDPYKRQHITETYETN